jgi:nitroimidazol reductase NimA-like FMN-containing flavoprotein (pyridoxamine 5'-phosphate oxidase superfamily)
MEGPQEADNMNTSTDTTLSLSQRPDHGEIEHLATAECWRLIEARSFGRLAVEALDGMPDVFPLNYTVHDGSIYIRSAPGSKLMAIAVHPVAAFEIDGEDDGFHWSVVLRGPARRLAIDQEIRESGVKALVSSSPTGKHHYICVTPSSISGRRFAAKPRSDTSSTRGPGIRTSPESAQEPTQRDGVSLEMPDPDSLRMERPVPIAHFAPR